MFLADMNNEEGVTSGASLVHACECHFSVHGSTVHGLEHVLTGCHANLSTVLNENSPVLVFFYL